MSSSNRREQVDVPSLQTESMETAVPHELIFQGVQPFLKYRDVGIIGLDLFVAQTFGHLVLRDDFGFGCLILLKVTQPIQAPFGFG
jgi:hypothetical protein